MRCDLFEQETYSDSVRTNFISKENIFQVLVGSSILSSGGGGDLHEAMERYEDHLPDAVEVRDLEKFNDDDVIATVFGLGPVENNAQSPMETAMASVRLFESKFEEIDGIILGEIGPALIVEALLIADQLDVPVVNADVAGMRSVPSIQNEIIEISDIERTPVVCTDGEDEILIEENVSGVEIENRIRNLTSGIWYITGYSATASEYQTAAAEGWFEECLDPIEGRAQVSFIGSGIIENVQIQNIDGHTVGRIDISGEEENYQVFLKNENLVALENGEIVAQAPEIITLVTEEGNGVYNGNIPDEGSEIGILRLEYENIWDEESSTVLNTGEFDWKKLR